MRDAQANFLGSGSRAGKPRCSSSVVLPMPPLWSTSVTVIDRVCRYAGCRGSAGSAGKAPHLFDDS